MVYAEGVLHTYGDVERALLSRIPEEHRNTFFAPPHPHALTERESGIAESVLAGALERIEQACARQEAVLIFGDYDADGVCATAVLWESLRTRGITAQPFLPHRERHGYGISVTALEEIWRTAPVTPTLIITVDNGIVAHEAVAWLQQRGVDTIITDHHLPGESLPAATHVVHTTQLCGTTIAWLLADRLLPQGAHEHLDLAAIATFADQVPLFGANRSFAVHGLQALRATQRPSLIALAESAGLVLENVSPGGIAFGLAPRINAMGRMGEALDALRALVSRKPDRVRALAQSLHLVNKDRQASTLAAWQEALPQAQAQSYESLIVVAGAFHEGIVGLVASKITEEFRTPSMVFSVGPTTAKASCRSVPGCNIVELLRSCTTIPYIALGGHAMAAGCTVPTDALAQARTTWQKAAKEQFVLSKAADDALGELDPVLLTPELTALLARFAPFGAGNPEPQFTLTGSGTPGKRVGRSGQHLRIHVDHGQSPALTVMWFGAPDSAADQVRSASHFLIQVRDSTFRPGTLDLTLKRVWE